MSPVSVTECEVTTVESSTDAEPYEADVPDNTWLVAPESVVQVTLAALVPVVDTAMFDIIGAVVVAGVVDATSIKFIGSALLIFPAASVTARVHAYVPFVRVFIAIVVVPATAAVVELVQPPVSAIIPDSVELNANGGVGFDVVASTPVTCVITGAVLSNTNVSMLET